MKHHSKTLKTAALLCGLSYPAFAGEPPAQPVTSGDSMFSDFNFCEWWSSKPGTIYKNPGNPWLSEVQIFGRYHFNAAYIDGEGTNNDGHFSDDYTDSRRFRLGAKVAFLNYFTFKGAVNLVDDQRFNGGDIDYGYQDFDEAVLTFDIKNAFSVAELDALSLSYGRFKWHGGLEARTSSNELLTVERSAISNKLYQSARPTGVVLNAAKGKWNGYLGVYSTDADPEGISRNPEFLGGWNDALMYTAEVIYSHSDSLRFGWEFLYNDANARVEDSLLQYKWATTLSAEYTVGAAGLNLEGMYGDNGGTETGNTKPRSGDFWGVVVTPYYWIVPAKLQAVVQYSYSGSDEIQGIRSNSRYLRATALGSGGKPDIVNGGRGNALHTVYGGLNYLICGDNLKFQAGVEYANLNAPLKGDGDATALTYLFGFRSFF